MLLVYVKRIELICDNALYSRIKYYNYLIAQRDCLYTNSARNYKPMVLTEMTEFRE